MYPYSPNKSNLKNKNTDSLEYLHGNKDNQTTAKNNQSPIPQNQMFPMNYYPNNPQSTHYDQPSNENSRPSSRHYMKDNPAHQQGFGMPQFVPMFMPMYQPQPYPYPMNPMMMGYQPQGPYNYARKYDEKADLDDVSIRDDKKKMMGKQRNVYKTSDQIVAEFKSQTLPKLRLKRLIKMQAVMKGYYVRRFKMPRRKMLHKICKALAEKQINNFIEDKLAADIAIEVLTSNKHDRDYTLYSHEMRNRIEITDKIIETVVVQLSREVCRETTNNLAYEFLRIKKGENFEVLDRDPFSLAAKDVIANFVTKNAEQIARESVKEMVDEYMLEIELNKMLKSKFIPKIAYEAAQDGITEVAIEEILNDKLDEMVRELAPAMIEVQIEELTQEATDKELDKAASNHIRRIILDVLVDNLRSMIITKHSKEQIADNMMRQNKQANYLDDDDDLELQDGDNDIHNNHSTSKH